MIKVKIGETVLNPYTGKYEVIEDVQIVDAAFIPRAPNLVGIGCIIKLSMLFRELGSMWI